MVTRDQRSAATPDGTRGEAGSRSVRRRTVLRIPGIGAAGIGAASIGAASIGAAGLGAAGIGLDPGPQLEDAGVGAGGDVRLVPGDEPATVTIPRVRPRPSPRLRPRPAGKPSGPAETPPGAADAEAGAVDAEAGAVDAPPEGEAGDGPDAVDAGDGVEGRSTARPGHPRRWRLLAGGLVVVLVALLVVAGLLLRQGYDQRERDGARDAALASARQVTVNFVSISASTVDRDLKRIADGATGQFKDEFTQDTGQVRAAVVANKVDSHGTVLRTAVVSADLRSAVILLAVDATVKNTSAPDGRLSHYRIQVNLSRDPNSGRWLVAQLQFVG